MEEAELWAASGAMSLSGRPDGPALLPPGSPATYVARQLDELARLTQDRTGTRPDLPSVQLLAERAAIAGLTRNGPWSCGGAFRMVPTLDGFFGLSLARPDDIGLLQALVSAASPAVPWEMVTEWAHTVTTDAAVERARLLGLPCAGWPPGTSARPGVVRAQQGGRRRSTERPVVLDLTSLWAGPLCAHLLGLAGCTVVKVESTGRPDGARRGPSDFFDLLHAGHESVALDFTDKDDQHRLRELLTRADVVLEASRPRALRGLGIEAAAYVAQGITWLSITAHGRQSSAVGFGDDIAVSAGLAVPDAGDLLPIGDAIADPLAGVAAATAVARALQAEHAQLIDVSMVDVARETVGETPDVDISSLTIAAPVARRPAGRAPWLGEHNEEWL